MKPSNKSILFFDGDCGLCSRSVRFLIKQDKRKRLYFAPLQGVAAQAILPLEYREVIDTIIYQRVAPDGQVTRLIRSDAALLALIDTGSLWKVLARITLWLPKRLRDWGYDRIAKNRSQSATCQMPSKAEHERILP